MCLRCKLSSMTARHMVRPKRSLGEAPVLYTKRIQLDDSLIFRYPGKLAWQLSAPKRIVRKSEPFKVFQRFLVGETEVVSYSH